MNDKQLMENLLLLTKGACDLYMHATIEASTPVIHNVFKNMLSDTLDMQNETYATMEAAGWYPKEYAPQHKIQEVEQKFTNQNY